MNQKRLYRSTDDRILAGVAGGVAEYFDVDPVIVRIIWFLSVFFTGTLTFWAYVVMIIVVPAEPDEWQQSSPWAPGGTPLGGTPSSGTPGTYAGFYAPPAGSSTAATPDQTASTETGAGGTVEGTAEGTPRGASGSAATDADQPAGGATASQSANVPPSSPPFTTTQPDQWTPAPGDWRWQRHAERAQRHAERWERHAERWERHGNGGLVFGLLLIVVGGLFAWHQIDPNVDLGLIWPIGAVALGLLLIADSVRFGSRR